MFVPAIGLVGLLIIVVIIILLLGVIGSRRW